MSSKIIVITTIILFLVSFSALFIIEAKNHDFDYKKSWSVVYFENPRDLPELQLLQAGDSLDFSIENHQGDKAGYDYKIFVGDDKVIDDKIEIEAGTKQKISPVIEGEKLKDKKVMIVVDYKDTEYKIYKNFGE